MRGLQVSRDTSDILYEAYRLVASGTKELIVIAQDSSAYGSDLRHRESEFQDRQVKAHLVPLVTELAQMGAWGRRFTPATPELSIRAQLLEEGGPQMWEAFMAELRSLHLGAEPPQRSVIRELTDAYLAVVQETADE